jgi:hypothetical protein
MESRAQQQRAPVREHGATKTPQRLDDLVDGRADRCRELEHPIAQLAAHAAGQDAPPPIDSSEQLIGASQDAMPDRIDEEQFLLDAEPEWGSDAEAMGEHRVVREPKSHDRPALDGELDLDECPGVAWATKGRLVRRTARACRPTHRLRSTVGKIGRPVVPRPRNPDARFSAGWRPMSQEQRIPDRPAEQLVSAAGRHAA